MKKISAVMRGEVAELKPRVARIFMEATPEDSPMWTSHPTLPCLIAFCLDTYDDLERECARRGREVDFDAVKASGPEDFARRVGLNAANIAGRYRTSFNCPDKLLERLDRFTAETLQEALRGQGRVNRNFSIMVLFRLAIWADADKATLPTRAKRLG